ncbi:otospiralin-like [Protopterus annectens]|uniref:otospiralin-like n=1 Tax=Protopterus annectens TaxID=7888 RepID=UPI001CF9A720|nr:otospiralin-like [Protopterus annectens]
MSHLQTTLLLYCCVAFCLITLGAAEQADGQNESRGKRSMPNWSMSASDFYGWVENLRNLAGYEKVNELARTYWAHFPIASHLGYEVPEAEE